MAGVSGGELAAGVQLAGGLGFIAVGYNNESFLIEQLEHAVLQLELSQPSLPNPQRSLPIGIGFITWKIQESVFDLALNANPKALWFSFGNYNSYLSKARHFNPNIKIFIQVDNVQEALIAAKDGADVIIAQGLEAGGHGPKEGLSTFVLISNILREFENIKNPPLVIAAGGIVDWRGLSGALAIGATGVVLGTALTVANESLLNPKAKDLIVKADSDSTLSTGVVDQLRGIDWDLNRFGARVLKNQVTTGEIKINKKDYESARKEGNYNILGIFAGMGVGLVKERKSAREIIDKIVKDYYYLHLQHRSRQQWIPVPSTHSKL
ncbi:NPD-domain-containing protein [Neoconidiobolus thromboides FSU 785]|nr:NPD-domain-containing protein [Neoconidiobolus thromboides FSU 785]